MIYTLIQREKTDSGTNWVNWGSLDDIEQFKAIMRNFNNGMIPGWYDLGFMVLTIEENTLKLQKAKTWLIEAGLIQEVTS